MLLVTRAAISRRTVLVRSVSIVLVVIATGLMAGCDGDRSQSDAPPGSPENPLVAELPESSTVAGRSNEAGEGATKSTTPARRAKPDSPVQSGSEDLAENQSHRPRDLMTPCDLVTQEEARAIFGAPIRDPLEAPQGPTCIYPATTGDGLVTLAVQSMNFRTLAPLIRQPRRVRVSGRIAYCGQYGQAMLYLPLSRGQVLSIAAPCPVARRFAARAVQRLGG